MTLKLRLSVPSLQPTVGHFSSCFVSSRVAFGTKHFLFAYLLVETLKSNDGLRCKHLEKADLLKPNSSDLL